MEGKCPEGNNVLGKRQNLYCLRILVPSIGSGCRKRVDKRSGLQMMDRLTKYKLLGTWTAAASDQEVPNCGCRLRSQQIPRPSEVSTPDIDTIIIVRPVYNYTIVPIYIRGGQRANSAANPSRSSCGPDGRTTVIIYHLSVFTILSIFMTSSRTNWTADNSRDRDQFGLLGQQAAVLS